MGYGQYAIETYLRQAPMLHVYELGDLDPAMQRHVRWFSRGRDGLPDAVALRFDGLATPTLIALAHDDLDALPVLVNTNDMPRRSYAHVTPGLQNVLAGVHKPLGRHLKMGLPRGTPLGPREAVIRFSHADADELDIWLSKDGQIVVFHDDNTKRITGVDKLISEQTFDELRALDAGAWKGASWKGEKIPTLGEALALLQRDEQVSPIVTLVTGPSRTADIELTLAIGVHGPQELYVIVAQG